MGAKAKSVDPPDLGEAGRPRVIVCGACDDKVFVYRKLDRLFRKLDRKRPVVCLQGRTTGLDKIVNEWAFGAGYLRKIFHPDVAKYGRAVATVKAVLEMVAYAKERTPSFVIVFGEYEGVVAAALPTGLIIRKVEVP